jgi:hypothetical protein
MDGVALRELPIRRWLLLYLIFTIVVCWTCYRQPVAEEFDRWMYDAVVRTNLGQDIGHVFAVIKHSSPRIEQSTAVASPDHLGIIEPMFAIKALYVELISLLAKAGIPIEKSITAVSIAALFVLALVIAFWTRRPVMSALLVISPATLALGRSGTPDALSTTLVLAGLWAAIENKVMLSLLLLLLSIWVRTDNLLLTLTVLIWMALSSRLRPVHAAIAALLAIISVGIINHFSGNYGWLVLFRCSFIGCKPPLDHMPAVSVREYVEVFLTNAKILAPQAALWLLLGAAAWRLNKASHVLLTLITVPAIAHFCLFPSPEQRTLTWAFLGAGISFVSSLRTGRLQCA